MQVMQPSDAGLALVTAAATCFAKPNPANPGGEDPKKNFGVETK